MNSLRDRVRWLVDTYHGGNVNRAAASIGVTQSTLNRIYSGDPTRKPRLEALESIASYHNTTIDWLLNGRGEAPRIEVKIQGFSDPETVAPYLAFQSAVRAAGVAEGTSMDEAMDNLWWPVFEMEIAAVNSKRAEDERSADLQPSTASGAAILRAYARVLREMIDTYSARHVEQGLRYIVRGLALQDRGFVSWLEDNGILSRGDLLAWFDDFREWRDEELARQQREKGNAEAKPEASPPPVRQRAAKKKPAR